VQNPDYVQFAPNQPDHFKITFSGVVEKEKDYPAVQLPGLEPRHRLPPV
jgi:hypothetical protein